MLKYSILNIKIYNFNYSLDIKMQNIFLSIFKYYI